MYYPYFRGKQFDLFAMTALLESNRLSQRIHPIIEPVKNSRALQKLIEASRKKEHPFYLIENPQAGDFLTLEGLEQLKEIPLTKAVILDQPLETLQAQPNLLIVNDSAAALQSDWQYNRAKILVPEEFRLLRSIQGEKILSQDPFTRLPRNSFYQECTDELFSVAHLTFQKRGFVGFSDFSIDSRIYYEHSYPSKLLCLHLVYFKQNQLRIHHFLSSEEAGSQKEMFLDMMATILLWAEDLWGTELTLGLELLKTAFENEKFPGMGVMRKAAVMHHLELMSRYLDT